ncbi:uncharacterized protein LOC108272987 isoform X13 [Ictalurus punctatus]|uniref:Uncharacterized protein LOC108272987 isoform X13 n=1 Tax=Ictalurus punctatus TaxID=7998 RepID=A0A9F7TLM9_ICTPU|nr:uncharacterized protein LOC108272987 isoform X13 [Ictalurus punctatus]
MASSHQSAREYIRDACENLLGRLQNLPLIVEKLHQQNVLNGNEVGDLEDEPVNCRKTRKILDWVINKGEEACYKFLRILDRERKSVLPKLDSSSLTPDLHTWICLFSFRDEPEDDYTQGPSSCHQLQKILKTRTKESLGEQWRQSQQFYGGKVQENFTFIPLVLDTDTEKNTPHNKIILKSKKSKKSRSKKLRAYIPRDTQRKSPEDLLNSEEKSILIVGKPGIGKTTVVQQMLHHWAERHDPNLDFMFYFDENTLSNTSTTVSLEHLLLSKVLMSNPQLKDNAEEILHYLQEYSERVTIVFDGIRDFPDNAFFLGIIQHDLLPEAKVVATCRPEVEYKFSDWTTCKVYVQGFSEESIYDFFRKMSGNDPEMVDSVINNPALFSLCHVPMYAFMVAACILNDTSEKAQKQCTASELYVQIFCDCLQRHGKKKLLHLDGHIKNCRDKVLSLAESAFNATKLKTIILEFDYYEKDIAGAFLKTVSVMSPARAKTFCAFPHNTMQEFFSALWLLEKTEIVDELLHLCQNEDSKHMKHVIPFLCGLQSHTNIDHLKCLFPLNKVMENIDSFFEKVLNTFLCDQPDDEKVDVAFICQCLYEYQSPETCCSFLERINYYLDLSEEHLDPYTCCAVSYVISQSRNKRVHLDLENSAVSLSGLKTVLDHSQYLRDLSATLCQVWTITLKCEELNYLIHLLQLCGNEIHIPVSSQTDVLRQAGKIITQYAEQTNLHLHCDKDSRQFSDLLCSTVFTWLPHISSLQFDSKQGEKEREERCRTFLLDLCLQAALHQPHNIQETVEKMMTIYYKEQSDFLLDLYSRVKQYESETGRRVLPALLPVYQSGPAVWYINLSERKVSLLLEVLKLQTEKKPVVLRDCSDEESEVRSFLQCLPYISHLRFKRFYSDSESTASIQFLLNLSIAAVDCKSDKGESFTELLASVCSYNTFPFGEEFHGFQEEQSDFLLDLYSRVKLYKSKTGRRVLPALLPVYQSVPAVWSINLSERKVSLLLEVLKLQTEKKPVVLRDWSDEKSEVRSFLQCLPYISHLRFDSKQGEKEREERCRTFLLDLCLQAALHQPHNIQETVEKVMTFYYKEQSDFLLDLYSRVKQYESETGRRVLPALLPVYQSGPAVWYIKLSERRVSLLLEVLKLQTEKKPVELRDCSDEESEVRSFLQCLPYISHLRFKRFYSDSESTASIQFLLNLSIAAVDCKSDKGESFTELLASVCSYNTFPFDEEYGLQERQSDFLLDLYSRVKQYESETGRRVLPALLPVYQSGPAVWYINLSERKVSLLLEVLKLQTKKKPVELRDCSDEESEVRSFLQCLPYISKIRFKRFYSDSESTASIQFLLNLSIAAVDCKSDKGESFTELLASACSYNTFPFGEEYGFQEEQSDFLLDLYSRVKQYESETGRRVLPALLPVYQSVPAVWSINLSKRKVSLLLEVLKLQTKKKPVELRDCSDEESEVRSFLQCLPYISKIRFKRFDSKHGEKEREERCRTFLLDLCLQAALHQPHNIQETVEKVITFTEYRDYYYYYDIQSDFLLDLYSRVKQYESETGRRVLPALLPVYQSVPAVWSIKLSERKVSLLLEVLKLQTKKKPVVLRDCSDEESEVRSFLQCLPYISHLRFKRFDSKQGEKEREERCRTFLLDLCLQAALHQPHNIQETVQKVITFTEYRDYYYYYDIQSDFLLDLYSRVKQYESETGRRVLPALLPVYQSVPAVWSINLSERKVSLLLEVLKLQTEKKPVELRDCSDEESEVRSFLQCLPYISHLRFNVFDSKQGEKEREERCRTFLLDLCLQAALHQPHNIQETVEKVMTIYYYEQSDFLLDLYSRVKQYESETGRRVLPALLPVYQSGPAVWSIKLSERKVSLLLEVLKLQTEKKPVELRDCSDEESEVRSFLQCLPYISHLRFNVFDSIQEETEQNKRCRTFLLDLCLQAALHQPHNIQETVEKVMKDIEDEDCYEEQSDFLLDLYSRVKQYESETGRSVLPALLPVYQSFKFTRFKWFDSKQGEKEREESWRTFKLDLCLQAALHQPHNIQETVEKMMPDIEDVEDIEDEDNYYEEQSDFLLDLYSRVKQYESETGRRVLPALLPVYQSGPAVWSIDLSERKVSLLLEVLKLQKKKKPVELRDCSDEESEVRSFLQCLPYISHLRFKRVISSTIQFLLNLSIAAVDCKSDKGESFTELLASVCSYNTFPFGEEYDGFQEEQSDFLLDLYSCVKQYESETGRRVLPALLPVYQSVPAVWYIDLSERKVSLLLEVLKLQTEKKPVELRDWSDEESEVRSFLQCLPYISELRCGENIIPRLSKAVVDYTEDTELVRAFFAAMDFIFVIHWVLTTRECRAVRKVLSLSDSKLKLTLKPRAISLRGARLLFRHITHLQKLCLSDRVVGRMVRAFGAVRAGGSLVIEELCMSLNSIKPKKEIFTFLSSLSSLLNIWTVHCVNLTECRMEAHSLISLMCHAGNLKIRLSKETLQQFTSLLCEVQDGELTRFFLEKVGGDLTSCSLSWEELIHFLQQRVCRISANIRKSKITYNHIRQILPLLSEIQFKRLNPSVVLSIIREIYETGSAHCVSSLLSSTHSCINLNNTELDSYHCTALCFTLQHCTSVSLSLLWTSIPEGELVKILPLFNRVSQLSVDRVLLLKLLHCCSISELQQGAVAAVFSALQNRLDFSCSTGLDLSTETQDNTLHLTTEDCSDISTAIQKSLQLTELNLKDCEMEDTGVDMFFLILHTVKLCCSKTLLLRFLARLQVVNELDCVRHAMYLSQALDGEMDLSETPLDLPACRSLALFLEFSEGLSELDLSHCQLADHSLELLFPYLHKAAVLDLSHNGIDDCLAGRIYTVVSTSSNIQTVRLFNNRITDIEPFRKDKRFEVW